MSIRLKLILFMFAFMAAAAILGMGALYIFSNLNRNLSLTTQEITLNRQYIDMRGAVQGLVNNATGWAYTGNIRYLREYKKSLPVLDADLSGIENETGDADSVRDLKAELAQVTEQAGRITRIAHPVGNADAQKALRDLEVSRDRILGTMDALYEQSISSMTGLAALGERIRRTMTGYLVVLVSFVSLAFIFLALFMRRMLSHPFSGILEATEKVAAGDLAWRIPSGRKDEFGQIASGFNRMVGHLEDSNQRLAGRLKEAELLLEVARIAGLTPELKDALNLIVDTVSRKMGTEACAVYLLYPEMKAFVLEAANTKNGITATSLPIESYVPSAAMDAMGPMSIEDISAAPEDARICGHCRSMLVAPILRDNVCKGLLVLGRSEAGGFFGPDEKNTVMILAHTIGVVVRNAELYTTTRKHLRQLSATYDLSRLLTSLYDPEELLGTISSQIAKLSGARICIIRILEGDELNVKSSYGIAPGETAENGLKAGLGIAGWVVKEGRSLFVEDVGKLPENLRPRTIKAKSAICVPLRVGKRIIGTLGIYDKTGPSGVPKPFDLDDLNMAEGFASLSAITIEKARMEGEEVKRRREIIEANKRLDLLFDTVQGGIVSLDSDYRILAANRYVERWVDFTMDAIVGKNAKDVFHPKGGICPHCAARATFDTGDISSITQSNGLNYAELTAYPVKGEDGRIGEAVIFIQDITDRVLYQEEIMGLYREVAQTKDYLESLINNSADAIVTTDLAGNIISWNRAAEDIYGYGEQEIVGKFLPFVPESAVEQEMLYMERIKQGDVIKAETFRRTKDGRTIEVNLTLSPIKDATGEVIGISGISQEITKKKETERELIRRNQELSRLVFISSAMRGTLDLERLLRMILTAVTMGDGLGFNRAILFWVDGSANVLKGAMGVGPASSDEAGAIWRRLTSAHSTLHDILTEIEETSSGKGESPFDRTAKSIEIRLDSGTAMARSVNEKRPFNIQDAKADASADPSIMDVLGSTAYAAVPIVSRNMVIGVLWVDNLYNGHPVSEEDMKFLNAFSNQMASAIENARLFEGISMAEAELENIFRSISDMVYLTDKDYNLKKANEAVLKKVGKSLDEVIGKKCYEIFHGTEAPFPSCPHAKTITSRSANIQEYEDPSLKGTFLSSTSPLFDVDGNFIGVVHVVRDITEMKELQERLQSAERMAALGEVAAKVAHEIRNPMVSVGGFAKRLEKKLDGSMKEYASIISVEVDRLEQILKEILGFVREARISRQTTLLDELLSAIINLIEPEAFEKGNTVRRSLDPVEAYIDPNRMKEALYNVIANANQSTDRGLISVNVFAENGEAVIEVSDTGCGIRKEDLRRIFDPFFTTKPTGTGLGLAISKRIVEEHGGRILVKSDWPDGGTGFKIYLPIRKEG